MTLVLTLDCLHNLILSSQGTVLRQFPLAWCFFLAAWNPIGLKTSRYWASGNSCASDCWAVPSTDKGAVIFACKECHCVIGSWSHYSLKKKIHAECSADQHSWHTFGIRRVLYSSLCHWCIPNIILFHNLLSGSSFWMWIQGYILFIQRHKS